MTMTICLAKSFLLGFFIQHQPSLCLRLLRLQTYSLSLDDLTDLILHHGRFPLFHSESPRRDEDTGSEIFEILDAGFEVHFDD